MPLMDVTDVLLDVDLGDTFTLTRRQQSIGDNGRTIIGATLILGQFGVFTASSKNDLERLPDNERMGQHYTLITKTMLRGPSFDSADVIDGQPAYLPDLVTWNGSDYIVKYLDKYNRFGAGFIQAIIGSYVSIEPAPIAPPGSN
jgi:hypothetical protein